MVKMRGGLQAIMRRPLVLLARGCILSSPRAAQNEEGRKNREPYTKNVVLKGLLVGRDVAKLQKALKSTPLIKERDVAAYSPHDAQQIRKQARRLITDYRLSGGLVLVRPGANRLHQRPPGIETVFRVRRGVSSGVLFERLRGAAVGMHDAGLYECVAVFLSAHGVFLFLAPFFSTCLYSPRLLSSSFCSWL